MSSTLEPYVESAAMKTSTQADSPSSSPIAAAAEVDETGFKASSMKS
jgi:hypothetical protein